jgi:hypothetical protein
MKELFKKAKEYTPKLVSLILSMPTPSTIAPATSAPGTSAPSSSTAASANPAVAEVA